jgi:hypothetical protein
MSAEIDWPVLATLAKENDSLRARVSNLEVALGDLRNYAASVWFDEANATDEEHELMGRSRIALSHAALPIPPRTRTDDEVGR